jgi:hypothetical protein
MLAMWIAARVATSCNLKPHTQEDEDSRLCRTGAARICRRSGGREEALKHLEAILWKGRARRARGGWSVEKRTKIARVVFSMTARAP